MNAVWLLLIARRLTRPQSVTESKKKKKKKKKKRKKMKKNFYLFLSSPESYKQLGSDRQQIENHTWQTTNDPRVRRYNLPFCVLPI
jgi:hypothetical protein